MKNVLAIGAHADDVEFGCGGYLWKLKEKNVHVDILVFRNEHANKPSFSRSKNDYIDDIHRAEKYWGFKFKFYEDCELQSGRPVITHDGYSIKFLDNIIHNYDLILCHNPCEHHQDHQTVFDIVRSCSRNYQGKILCYESPHYVNGSKFFPNVFIDITDTFHHKLELIKCYQSYVKTNHIKCTESLATLRSCKIENSKFAEAFSLMQDIIK